MTPQNVERLGRLLYGERYQAQLARELGVSRQSVVIWSKGESVPSADNVRAMRRLLRQRIRQLQALGTALTG